MVIYAPIHSQEIEIYRGLGRTIRSHSHQRRIQGCKGYSDPPPPKFSGINVFALQKKTKEKIIGL